MPGLLFIASTPHLLAAWVGDMMALSSSRTTPLNTCPAHRPRWCPVYSPSLFAHRTSAFQQLQTVGFPILTSQYGYLSTTSIPFSRLNHAACILAPSSSVLPLLGLHVDFATDLLARLWSGGTFTHWVILTNFLEGFFSFLYSQGLGFISTRAICVLQPCSCNTYSCFWIYFSLSFFVPNCF